MPLPVLADDIVWSEVPIIGWLAFAIVFMLIAVARFGWGGAPNVLVKCRLFWGGSLALAVISAAVLHVVSGQPLPRYRCWERRRHWLTAPRNAASSLQEPAPNDALVIVDGPS